MPTAPERAHPNANTAVSVPTAQDDVYAESSGDVYFYSPENLDPDRPGIPNERNLYLARGAVACSWSGPWTPAPRSAACRSRRMGRTQRC